MGYKSDGRKRIYNQKKKLKERSSYVEYFYIISEDIFFLPLCLCLWRFEFSFFSFEICRKGGKNEAKVKMNAYWSYNSGLPSNSISLASSFFLFGGTQLDFHLMCMSVYTLHRSNSRIGGGGWGGRSFKIEANMGPPPLLSGHSHIISSVLQNFLPPFWLSGNMSNWKK